MRFDPKEALEFALLAQRAYGPCTITNPNTDTQVLIEPFRDGLGIANRGTDDTEGWLRDLDIRKVTITGGIRVHAGFYLDMQSVLPQIEAQIPSKGTPLYLAAHSKGAGEECDLALALCWKGYSIRRIWTFGQPRVGNRIWRDEYNRRLGDITTRLTNGADIVPFIPSVNYWHELQHVWMPATGGVVFNPSLWQMLWANKGEIFKSYAARQLRKAGHPEDLWPTLAPLHQDHAIQSYIDAIKKL